MHTGGYPVFHELTIFIQFYRCVGDNFIILGIGISSYQALRSQREISASILEDAPAVSEEKEVVTE